MLREASISGKSQPVLQNAIGMALFGLGCAKFTVGKKL
jgi:hypothetical protein